MKFGGNVSERSMEASVESARRLPFWVVGSVLVGVVLLMLAAALLLDRRLRPSVGIEPVENTAATPSIVSPVGVGTPAAPIANQDGLNAQAGHGVALSLLERDIQGAFERYLQVYRQAVWDLDASHLQEVLDGQALKLVSDEVSGLKAQGRPVKIIEEDRSVALAQVTETTAVVVDEYVSLSVYADPTTREPLPRTGPSTKVRQTYELRKVNGSWKVVDGTREVLSEGSS